MRAKITTGMLIGGGALSACASLFFCYYTLRLAYLGATGSIDAAHRTAGMHIGAVVFPIASFSFGWISLACFNSACLKRIRSTSTAARTRTTIRSGWDLDS